MEHCLNKSSCSSDIQLLVSSQKWKTNFTEHWSTCFLKRLLWELLKRAMLSVLPKDYKKPTNEPLFSQIWAKIQGQDFDAPRKNWIKFSKSFIRGLCKKNLILMKNLSKHVVPQKLRPWLVLCWSFCRETLEETKKIQKFFSGWWSCLQVFPETPKLSKEHLNWSSGMR